MKKKNSKTKKKLLIILGILVAAVVALFITYAVQTANNKLSRELSKEEVQKIIDDAIERLPSATAYGAKYVMENTSVTVKNVTFGTKKDVIAECSYETPNAGETIIENLDTYLTEAYTFYNENNENGKKTYANKIKQKLAPLIEADIEKAGNKSGEITLEIYEIAQGEFVLYLSDEAVNTVFGGLVEAIEAIENAQTVKFKGETIQIGNYATLRNGIKEYVALRNYNDAKPDTNVPIIKAWNNLKDEFYRNFIEKDRWTYITNGLATTLAITLCAVLLGIFIGFIVAVIRCVNQKTEKLEFFSDLCKIYLAVMRGTPVMVQLIIIYFVVLLPLHVPKFIAAVLCFGLNSGAYVSEIIRGGIMSVDEGQTEAGRSLGFTYMQTMRHIIIPQAFKAVLPALANEFIALLKESSIAFYIGVADLTMGGIKIRSITYSNFMPLIAVAIVYLVVVLGLSKCVSILERRLGKGDKR